MPVGGAVTVAAPGAGATAAPVEEKKGMHSFFNNITLLIILYDDYLITIFRLSTVMVFSY